MKVETKAEADRLNRTGETEPYAAANGHLMIAALRFPTVEFEDGRVEREYRVGDEIRYESWSAWCAPGCSHAELGPLPDW
ncbi:MAG: hypothetical protein ACOYB2_10735 [Limnohabitans sp.]